MSTITLCSSHVWLSSHKPQGKKKLLLQVTHFPVAFCCCKIVPCSTSTLPPPSTSNFKSLQAMSCGSLLSVYDCCATQVCPQVIATCPLISVQMFCIFKAAFFACLNCFHPFLSFSLLCFPSTFQHVASKPLCKLVFAQSDVSPAEYTFLRGSAKEASFRIFFKKTSLQEVEALKEEVPNIFHQLRQ